MLSTNPLIWCFSGNVLISSFLKDDFGQVQNSRLIVLFFSPQHFEHIILLLLPSMVSCKKTSINLFEDSVNVINHFCCFQEFLFVFSFWKFECHVSTCEFLWVYPTLNLLSFLYLQVNVFNQFGEVLSHYLFRLFFCYFLCLFYFWNFHYTCAWWRLTLFEVLFILLYCFFFSPVWIILICY